jgi:drug/metabolite transporter (DMT)-like permease
VLNGTVPLFTIICAHLFIHDDRMTRRRLSSLLVGFVGVIVLVQNDLREVVVGGEGVKWQLLGQLAMLGSSFLYAVSNVYGRAKFRNVPPIFQAFYTMLAADAIMWIVTPVVDAPFTLPAAGTAWLAIAWLGTLGAGISYLLYYYLLHSIGPTRVAMVTYTIPVVGVTLGVVFLGEALTWPLVAGSLLIVSGVWGTTRK